MSETPIGDAVEAEVMGEEQESISMESPYAIPGEEPEGWVPNAEAVDPEPVMNEDAEDDLADVAEGEDDGETPLEDDGEDAEPAESPAEPSEAPSEPSA